MRPENQGQFKYTQLILPTTAKHYAKGASRRFLELSRRVDCKH